MTSIKQLSICAKKAFFGTLKLDTEKGAAAYYETVVREMLKARGNFDILKDTAKVRAKLEEAIPADTFLINHEKDVNLTNASERIKRMAEVFENEGYIYAGDGEFHTELINGKSITDGYSFKVLKGGDTYAVKMMYGKTGLSMLKRAKSWVGNSVELYFRQKVTGFIPLVFSLAGDESSYESVTPFASLGSRTKVVGKFIYFHDFTAAREDESTSHLEELERSLSTLSAQDISCHAQEIESADCEMCPYRHLCKIDDADYVQGLEELQTVTREPEEIVWTDAQEKLINTRKGETRVYACAGSGKTTGIAEMVARMSEEGVPFSSITLCTFMNKGVLEIKEKIKERLVAHNSDLHADEFHIVSLNGLGYEIIKRNNALSSMKEPKIISENEYLELIAKVADVHPMIEGLNYADVMYKQFKALGAVHVLRRFFDLIKQKGSSRLVNAIQVQTRLEGDEYAKKLADDSGAVREDTTQIIADMYNEVQNLMKEQEMITFSDQIQQALRILRHNPTIKKEFQDKCKYLIIDEFQDTSSIQMDVIKELYTPSDNSALVVVGDASQAIMSFRNVGNENIVKFHETFPNAITIDMNRNFRSSRPICELAENVMKNIEYTDVRLLTNKEGSDPELVLASSKNEANTKAYEKVLSWVDSGVALEDIAVIARSRAEIMDIRKKLTEHGIPTVLSVSDFLKDDNQVIAAAGLASFIRDPQSVINLAVWCRRTNKEGFDIAESINDYLGAKAIEINAKFNNLTDTEMYDKFIETVKEAFPVLSNSMSFFLTSEEDQKHSFIRVANSLKGIISNKGADGTEKKDIVYRAVTLSTVHAAKGREWKNVVVLTDGLKIRKGLKEVHDAYIVDLDFSSSKELEEEARCLFVAVTRAKDNLTVIGNGYWDTCLRGLNFVSTDVLEDTGVKVTHSRSNP